MAEMAAKYGVSGNAQPQPAPQQPAPQPATVQQPAPQPQPRGIGGILGIVGGRQQQIDKASGFRNGGKIQGPGTPTSDSIPAKVNETGEDIVVSTDERILSADQDAMLEAMARKSGFDNLDAMLEAGTGKPVGPTIKAGKRAAAGGLRLDNEPDEYAKAIQQQVLGRDAQGNGSSWSVGAGQKPTIGTMPVTSDRVSGSLPVANAPKESNPLTDGVKPWYAGSSTADNRTGLEMERSRRSEAASAGVLNDPVKSALQYGVVGQNGSASAPTPVANPLVSGVQQNYGNEGRSVPSPITKQNPSAVVDNQFTQGGKNYTVNTTSQEGISKVTAPGASPLYTNIKPEQAVSWLNNQMIGGDSKAVNEGIARMENANKIRGEMIANRDKDIPSGGYAPGILGDGGVEAANAEKTQRWRNDELVRQAKKGNQAAIGALLNADGHRDVAAMGNETARLNAGIAAQVADKRDQVTMRGQDLNAQNELLRLSGNPLDNQSKQLALTQAQKISRLQDTVLNGKTPEERAAAASNIRALAGKQDREDRTVKPMEIADPNDPMGQRKILVRPNDDGTYTTMRPRRSYAEFAQAYLSKKPGTSPEQMKADYEQLYGSR